MAITARYPEEQNAMPWPTTYNTSGLILTTVEGTIHGQNTNQTLWLSRPGELGQPDWPTLLAQAATLVLQCAITHLLPGLSSDFTLRQCRAKLMTVADKQERIVSAAQGSVGALGEALPSFVSGVIQWRTPYSGKRRRGRMSVPGLAEANTQQSSMGQVPITALAAFAACLLEQFRYDVAGAEFHAIIYSRRTGYTPPSTYSAGLEHFAPIVGGTVRSTLGSVNSRKVNRGS